jgi:hypothetical protein
MKISELEEEVVDKKKAKQYTVSVDVSNAISLLTTYCSEALASSIKSDKFIYKGLEYFNKPYYAIDSSKIKRQSQNTVNFYTEYVSKHSANWKMFPRRDHCLVCSTSSYYANNYGTLYMVFPADGTKIGICPEQDFWESFRGYGKIKSMGSFADFMEHVMVTSKKSNMDEFLNKPISDCSFKDDWTHIKTVLSKTQYFSNVRDPIRTTVGQALNDKLDPLKNGFSLFEPGQIHLIPNNKEVWFSGKCVIVQASTFKKEIMPAILKDTK